MTNRFFLDPPVSADLVRLPPSEAHHLAHVMRRHVGDEVILFDGTGAEYTAQITSIRRTDVELRILRRAEVDRELPLKITLGVGLPKGDRQRWLIEKAVELGVDSLVPLETEHGVAQPAPSAVERLGRFVIEASKQCGRNRLMEVAPARPLAKYLEEAPGTAGRWLAHPGGVPLDRQAARAAHICIAIGPEGGFSDRELELARAGGWEVLDLGARTLRVETAALMLSAYAASLALTQ